LKKSIGPAGRDASKRTSFGSARVALQLLEVSERPEEMNVAGFHFHGLHGKPKRWSLRVTGNYRITFGWSDGNALDVDFEDYH
jgi:toxin HigB-1